MKINFSFDGLTIRETTLSEKTKLLDLVRKSSESWLTRWIRNLDGGKDAHGNSLKAYSQSYRDQIEANGGAVYYYRGKLPSGKKKGVHRGKRYPKSASPTNLLVSGSLRRSMHTRSIPNGAELYFQGNHQVTGKPLKETASQLHDLGYKGWFEPDDLKDLKPLQEALGEAFQQLVLDRFVRNTLLEK